MLGEMEIRPPSSTRRAEQQAEGRGGAVSELVPMGPMPAIVARPCWRGGRAGLARPLGEVTKREAHLERMRELTGAGELVSA